MVWTTLWNLEKFLIGHIKSRIRCTAVIQVSEMGLYLKSNTSDMHLGTGALYVLQILRCLSTVLEEKGTLVLSTLI